VWRTGPGQSGPHLLYNVFNDSPAR